MWALRNVFSYTMPWRCVPDRDFSLYDASLGHCVPWTKRPWLWWVPTLDRIQVVDKYNHRDQRGVPLLTVETEANGDSWSTYRALAALVCLVQHIFFLTAQFFNLVVPIARSYLSRQSRWIACLRSLIITATRKNCISFGAMRAMRKIVGLFNMQFF